MSEVDAAKSAIIDAVDARADRLIEVSRSIHAHPELNFEERFAHDLLCDVLESAGLPVTRHAYGVETAFEAVAGDAGPEILVLLEYDALPGIGHGCGHNVIAAAGLGAGLAVAGLATALGGRVRILGTPAEEGGGGKIYLARNGAFASGDAAMMVHPADADLLRMHSIAIHTVDVEYAGRAAHAAAAPWEGRNALDAAVLGYMNVAALRQHIRPTERVHGIFTHGGDKPNIVPKFAAMNWYVRSDTLETLQPLKGRVEDCFNGAAMATGCGVDVRWEDHAYADLRDSHSLIAAYRKNANTIGRNVSDPSPQSMVVGSTDMGNVSYLVPSIHPMIQVAPRGVPIHTARFAQYAGGPEGDRAVVDGAKMLAMTALDVWGDASLREAMNAEFERIGEAPAGLL